MPQIRQIGYRSAVAVSSPIVQIAADIRCHYRCDTSYNKRFSFKSYLLVITDYMELVRGLLYGWCGQCGQCVVYINPYQP